MAREFHNVVEGQTFTEGVRWHDGRLFFSDLYTHRVQSVREDGTDLRLEAQLDDQPSGLGWLPDGRLLISSMLEYKLLRREHDGSLVVHADLDGRIVGWMNDLAVDRAGHAYVGHFGFDLFGGDAVRSNTLLRVDPDGTVAVAADDLYFPNGGTFVKDDVLVISESYANRLTAFDVQPDGTLTGRREWARFGDPTDNTDAFGALGDLAVAPDGTSAVDAEGAVWVADFTHGRVLRVHPERGVVDEIAPNDGVFAAALGGEDGHTLFLCVAPGFDPEERKKTTEGRIIATRVEVPAA
ncbi:SMP-30/gluconolactonase/LRE family protein [Microbacterium sp. No. 7]|uniref:SMP-30/gluconolactonase/LRE family protein n=1 Tax=Microbacterium sp. No. 7 TaxID=1714373 RepID=UPI0006D02B08|nr:SMP-30/gluconolactonase/LRE family protein [Microbacterium sp. No. 7]ALJ18909.1 gluconolactonase [Microbacterium sp. No. 7]